MARIKAVIFDMDGVLIDAKEWHYEALNKALSLFGMEINRYDHLFTYDGLPTKKKLAMLSMEQGLPQELHEFLNEVKQQYTMEIACVKCSPDFIHEYALSMLKSEGYRIAVCSNSVRKTVDLMMEKSDLQKYIDFCISNEDVSNPKPDPEMYLKAILQFKLKPEECLVVEDNENGVKAALAGGCNLLKVDNVEDVSYEQIKKRIAVLEGGQE